MSKFEVIRGVEGCCLALDDTRIAGPKPWGGGTVIHTWEISETYEAVDSHSRWHQLFGTPERAARTAYDMHECSLGMPIECDDCTAEPICKSGAKDYDALIEWLRGESE